MTSADQGTQAPPAVFATGRDAVVDEIYSTLAAAHPEVFARFGDDGRRACREDLGFHLDFLEAAAACSSPSYFGGYAAWAATVLESRGVDTGLLAETLQRIRDAVGRHVEAAHAEVVLAALDAGVAAVGEGSASAGVVDEDPHAVGAPAHELADRLVRGDRRGAWDLIDALTREGRSYLDIAVGTIQPALHRIGQDWQHHRISVAQEHLATSLALHALTRTFASSAFAPPNGRRAIIASVAGNHHALGGRIVADAMTLHGWDVHDLGADVPTKDLVRHVGEFRPDLLGLSLALPRHLTAARSAIAAVRATFGSAAPAIVVGGRPFLGLPGLARHLGADASVRDAVQALAELD